jgi:hypothetical protein
MSPKHCPHCLKRVPFRKRFRVRCPFCFKPFRRRSGTQDRTLMGQWLEDRSTTFWFFNLAFLFVLLAVILQVSGYPDLIGMIDSRPVWFTLSIAYLAMFAATVGRIYFPLLLGAPKILRRERAAIRQYKVLTSVGLILGVPFAMLFLGTKSLFRAFPGTVFLFIIPTVILWAYHALTLTEEDYEDERVWSFLQEVGAAERLEHRHHAYMVLVGLPLCGLAFWYFLTHPYLANMLMESADSGIIAMFRELWLRTTGRVAN